MTKTEKIARGVSLIEEHIFGRILDFENYTCFSGRKIEYIDDFNEDELEFEIEFKVFETKKIEFLVRVNVEKNTLKINIDEDVYEEFSSFDSNVSEFWRVLFFKALDK